MISSTDHAGISPPSIRTSLGSYMMVHWSFMLFFLTLSGVCDLIATLCSTVSTLLDSNDEILLLCQATTDISCSGTWRFVTLASRSSKGIWQARRFRVHAASTGTHAGTSSHSRECPSPRNRILTGSPSSTKAAAIRSWACRFGDDLLGSRSVSTLHSAWRGSPV